MDVIDEAGLQKLVGQDGAPKKRSAPPRGRV